MNYPILVLKKSNTMVMKRKHNIFFILILLLSFSSVFQASAQQKVELPELKQKQKGIYTRLSSGIAMGNTNYKSLYDIKGTTIPFVFQLGYQTAFNVAIYFNYNVLFVLNPQTDGKYAADLMTIPQFGGGLSFYFGKGKNYIYVDANSATTRLLIDSDVYATDPGFGLNVGWGYDHNLVKHVSIGGAIFYHYSTMKDKDSAASPLKNNYLGVCLSFRFGK
jgi:hypothetical protein